MTRLRTEDIKDIPQALKAYDQQLLNKTGQHFKRNSLCTRLNLHDDLSLRKSSQSMQSLCDTVDLWPGSYQPFFRYCQRNNQSSRLRFIHMWLKSQMRLE